MKTLSSNNMLYRQGEKANRIERTMPILLLICFVFQQFGFSFHLSFGSLGLFLLTYLVRRKLSVSDFIIPMVIVFLVVFSFFFVLVKYGYDEQLLRILPVSIAILILFSILRDDMKVMLPSTAALVWVTIAICSVVWYQVFVDRSAQVPEYIFSMGSNISLADDAGKYEYANNALRSNGIYSEPSYMGMVLCCLFVFIFKSVGKYRVLGLLVVVSTQLITGSVLGIVGMAFVAVILARKFTVWNWLLIGVLGISVAYFIMAATSRNFDFAFGDRIGYVVAANDSSSITRLITPFVLVYENFMNFDWFGVPSNYFKHFAYTNLYTEMGDFPGHNGLLSMLILYGINGVVILYVLFSRLKNSLEWMLVLIIGSQNGGLLTYEKAYSLLFVILALRGIKEVVRATPQMKSMRLSKLVRTKL